MDRRPRPETPARSRAATLARSRAAALARSRAAALARSRSTALVAGSAALVAACVVAGSSWGAAPDVAAASAASHRVAGDDPAGTAAALSREFFAPDVVGRQVFLVNGDAPSDALVAAPAAAALGAPLLLTGTALPTPTAEELQRLRPAVVQVVGGETWVPAAVLEEVARLLPGARVERTSGADRYDTSARVAQRFFPTASSAVLARGDSWADAVAGGAAAAGRALPLLLTGPDGVPPAVRDWVGARGLRSVLLVGADVPADLTGTPAAAAVVTRLSGDDRYDTAARVARSLFPRTGTALVASGTGGGDVLAAIPAARAAGAPLLLGRDRCAPPAVLDYAADAGPEDLVLVGAPTAVADPLSSPACA